MRTEQEMLNLVLDVAARDERVRVVAMNGSRTNKNIEKDHLQDYDIVYLVNDLPSFIKDLSWVDVFGERIIMQTPEAMSMFPPTLGNRFSYLMLFADGNRIDLMLIPLEEKERYAIEDGLTIILLDKDGIMPEIPEAHDTNYWVQKPSIHYYTDCCNEFWWVSTYVAKGLWRKELLYALDHLSLVREMLLTMLTWKIGIETNFTVNIGKSYKYIEKYLEQRTWKKLLHTFPKAEIMEIWSALFTAMDLFELLAKEVSEYLQIPYQEKETIQVRSYVKNLKND